MAGNKKHWKKPKQAIPSPMNTAPCWCTVRYPSGVEKTIPPGGVIPNRVFEKARGVTRFPRKQA